MRNQISWTHKTWTKHRSAFRVYVRAHSAQLSCLCAAKKYTTKQLSLSLKIPSTVASKTSEQKKINQRHSAPKFITDLMYKFLKINK